MTLETITTALTAAIIWLFDAIIAIGSIQHRSTVLIDMCLIGVGMMLRPAGRVGGRMYSKVKIGVQEIVKR